jgi:hypothetical protein
MKKWNTIGILAVMVIGIVLISGCTSTAPMATPTPQIVYVTVLVTPTPTLTSTPTQQIVTVLVTQTPTPIPTINKNSAAYQDYKQDLQEITDIQTDLSILDSTYYTEVKKAGWDTARIGRLEFEYKELKDAYAIRLKAAQDRAAADLADAGG